MNELEYNRLKAGSPIFASCITFTPPLPEGAAITPELRPLVKRCACGCRAVVSQNKNLTAACIKRLQALIEKGAVAGPNPIEANPIEANDTAAPGPELSTSTD